MICTSPLALKAGHTSQLRLYSSPFKNLREIHSAVTKFSRINMLQPNNTEIDIELLRKKIKVIKLRVESECIPTAVEAVVQPTDEVEEGSSTNELEDVACLVASIPVLESAETKAAPQRTQSVFSPGISWRHRIGLIPIIGSGLIWITSIFRLNAIRHKIAVDFDVLREQNQRLQEQIMLSQQVLNERISQIEAQFGEQQSQIFLQLTNLQNSSVSNRFERIESEYLQQKRSNLDRDNRIASLLRELRQLSVASSQPPSAPSHASLSPALSNQAEYEDVPGMDRFYVEFEDNFRGSFEDITARLKVYLPYLMHFSNDASATVIDIGCGRGEWLRLLQQNAIQAVGIDMNSAMVDACKEQGLTAYCLDAIAYLRQQPEASLAAITGFHIIEHLPFKLLLSLFDAALRALRPDGLIIFESPNPENLAVGAFNFYFDPTHLNPVVPAVAQFMAKQRGFAKADILRLHPYPDDFKVPEDSELARQFNAAFYGPQDFAVIAWKSNGN